MKNYSGTKADIINLTIASIQASAFSLQEQLKDYDFLDVTDEQTKKLEKIYTELHNLVHQITD